MRVPALDLKPQLATIRGELLNAVAKVIDSTGYIMGPAVAEFEKTIADYLGVKQAIGVSSGTDALLLALMALKVGPGDAVITTPYSFFATAGVVARLNARILLTDIDPDTYNMDPQKVKELLEDLSSVERRTVKAIMPVHLYGQAADMTPLMSCADRYGIPVVEDAAQAIGARYPLNGKAVCVGTIGKAGCFSFFPSKNLGGIGDGGLIVTNDEEYADFLRVLRVHGAKPKYCHSFIGGNFRLDTVQAAALQVKLPHLQDWTEGRQRNAEYYDEKLASIPEVKTPKTAYRREFHIYNQYVISALRRDELAKYLEAREIGVNIYYPVPFHLQPCFRNLGYGKGDFPASERAAETTLALPIYKELSREQLDWVVSSVREFYRS